MGIYLNPGNDLFEMSVNSEIFIDKTMMIEITNSALRTDKRHICISRPRRFGKSMAANMLAAYYSRGCDSADLFKNLAVSETEYFEKHLNKYNNTEDIPRLCMRRVLSFRSVGVQSPTERKRFYESPLLVKSRALNNTEL